MIKFIIRPNKDKLPNIDSIGGKGRSLFRLISQGFTVPETVCLSSLAFNVFVRPHRALILETLKSAKSDEPSACIVASSKIMKILSSADIPKAVETELDAWVALQGVNDRFAVRSSACAEDGETHSFAGQFSTFLNVKAADIHKYVRKCWSDAFSPSAIAYALRAGVNPVENPMAIVLQDMVDAKAAGVMFQADPCGDVSRIIVSAGFGLGEGVVSGLVQDDTYTYDRFESRWHSKVALKDNQIIASPDGGVKDVELPRELREQAVLGETDLSALLELSTQITTLDPAPQDIEWTVAKDGKVYVLQSRPITTLPPGKLRLLDNANIAESYPGVVLPMTASVLKRDYDLCFRAALRQLGMPSSILKKLDHTFNRTVEYVNGRVFYNMDSWNRLTSLTPFAKEQLADSFHEMVNAVNNVSLTEGAEEKKLSSLDNVLITLRLPFFALKALLWQKTITRRYFKNSAIIGSAIDDLTGSQKNLDDRYYQFNLQLDEYMRLLGVPFTNDIFCVIFMAALKSRIVSNDTPEEHERLNSILANQGVESTKPAISVIEMSKHLTANAELMTYVDRLTDEDCLTKTDVLSRLNETGYSDFAKEFQRHIDKYGHRSPKELVLEEKTYHDRPLDLLRQIQLVAQSSYDSNLSLETNSHDDSVARSLGLLDRFLLRRTKSSLAYREATRLDRGWMFEKFRKFFIKVGLELKREGHLIDEDDIFYLSMDDVKLYISGFRTENSLLSLVERRKETFSKWREMKCPGKFYIKGRGRVSQSLEGNDVRALDQSDNTLTGIGCSQGIVKGEAVVVESPNDVENVEGKILVSKTTDPGWVFLMMAASGLIAERGSPISHTAIIGRELKIPTVVSVSNATHIIQSGDLIELDGASGKIKILERARV